MKTIITQTIDGIEIITAVSDAQIDPEKTIPKAVKAVEKTDTHRQIDALKKEITSYIQSAAQAMKHAKGAVSNPEKQRFSDEYRARMLQVKDVEDKIKPLAVTLKNEYRQAMTTEAVYFQPKPGEHIVPNGEEIRVKLNEAIQAGKQLGRDLKQIDDYRGKVYHKKIDGKWMKQEVTKLGEKPLAGGILAGDLTPEQIAEISKQAETDRIKALKPVDREAEKMSVIDGLIAEASAMRGRLEITGDKDALKKAQDWYNAEVAKVEAVYA